MVYGPQSGMGRSMEMGSWAERIRLCASTQLDGPSRSATFVRTGVVCVMRTPGSAVSMTDETAHCAQCPGSQGVTLELGSRILVICTMYCSLRTPC